MQFEFTLNSDPTAVVEGLLALNGRKVPLALVRNRRARRYVLRMRSDGSARVTIPLGGSPIEARRFLERNRNWLERQLQRLEARPRLPRHWFIGTQILFEGQPFVIEAHTNGDSNAVCIGNELVPVKDAGADLRREVERYLWKKAAAVLPPRVHELAALHRWAVQRVTVRNQRSRWGSCSRRGTVSLNWRLIQAPLYVRDYIILHELCHLDEMNHSHRFWAAVERVFPDFRTAEHWLKTHAYLLR